MLQNARCGGRALIKMFRLVTAKKKLLETNRNSNDLLAVLQLIKAITYCFIFTSV